MNTTQFRRWRPIVLSLASALAAALSSARAVELDPPAPNPVDPVDYITWINQASGADTEDTASKAYQKVAQEFTPITGDWGDTLDGPWTQNAPVTRFIRANRKAFELYRAAARRGKFTRVLHTSPGADPRMSRMLMMVELPDLGLHRAVAKGLVAEGFRAWAAGHQALLLKNVNTVLRAAHHLFSSTTLLERLVGTADAALAYSAILKALELSDDPGALAKQLREDLKTIDREFPPLGHAILFERLSSWDRCQRIFVPGNPTGRWELHEPCVKLLKEGLGAEISRKETLAIRRIGFDKTLREIDAYYDAFEQWTQTPYHLTAKPVDREKEHFDRFLHIPMQTKNPLVRIFLPSLTRARELDEQVNATRNATHLIVLLFLHRAEHGKFPRTLDELPADDLSLVRVDPFSGSDFVYKRKQRGKNFALFSLSHNLADDGGRHASWSNDGDYVFWPVQK